jgi:two-component system, NtrC family, response regulator PilR
VKLLRVLQEREFRRIGGTKDIKVDVRVIAATNRDLERAVKEGTFREDLFYRLDVIPIVIPPLRERIEDVPFLAEHFVRRFSKTMGKEILGITPDGMALLKSHEWRGNVRELENVLERSVALATGNMLSPEDFRESLQTQLTSADAFSPDIPAEGMDLEVLVEKIERRLLMQALERSNWVKKEAAKLLNLSFRSFRYRLSKYNILRSRRDAVPQNTPE